MSQINRSRFIGFERLKQSVTMEQVLHRYGLLEQLRRCGDSLSGVCPIHDGHNPGQFRVSLVKNCWFCFGDCRSGGSIVDFVARKEGIGIREAGLRLQDWFHLRNGNGSSTGNTKPNGAVRRKPMTVRKEGNPPLRFELHGLDAHHRYLQERRLTAHTIATFGLGYCSRGSLGGWIVIPIHDAQARLIAYAGRWPGDPPDDQPKYRLPCGFHKSIELFNHHRAAKERRGEPLVIVEGFFGCMAVWQAGHRRVVALMGSILSPAQEDRIVELVGSAGRVLLLFDGDTTGRHGAAETRARLARRIPVHVIELENGQQPDSIEPDELLGLVR